MDRGKFKVKSFNKELDKFYKWQQKYQVKNQCKQLSLIFRDYITQNAKTYPLPLIVDGLFTYNGFVNGKQTTVLVLHTWVEYNGNIIEAANEYSNVPGKYYLEVKDLPGTYADKESIYLRLIEYKKSPYPGILNGKHPHGNNVIRLSEWYIINDTFPDDSFTVFKKEKKLLIETRKCWCISINT